jgi:molybdate transport repressor ModE-like protein
MPLAHRVLTPDALEMLQTIASTGSFAAAARQMNMVPSALTYRVRQMEDTLDVLLFDRSSRQAKLTPAGSELLHEGKRLLKDMEALANRVRRVATGWEAELTIAVDTIISPDVVLDLCEKFFATSPPTRIRLRDETLVGTLEALTSGQADLAIGLVAPNHHAMPGVFSEALGSVQFVYAVAPHHPLAHAAEPLRDAVLQQYRAVAVADTAQRQQSMTIGLLDGQDVFTVASMQAKLKSQLRGVGSGFLPYSIAGPYLRSGDLVAKMTEHPPRQGFVHYAWRAQQALHGRALQWWLEQLQNPITRNALLQQTSGDPLL